jgi:hypothetical protein
VSADRAATLVSWRVSGDVIPRAQSLAKHPANLRRSDPLSLAGRGRRGGFVGSFAVTRDRHESVRCRGLRSFPGDLPTRVDAISVLKKGSIGVMNEGIEFCHRTVLPKEGTAAEGGIA